MAGLQRVRITIPYAPRRAFQPFHNRKHRWSVLVCHRRAGKTVACINELIKEAAICDLPSPRFAYVAPELGQAKDIAWSYLLRFTECFGADRRINHSELWVELPNNDARIRIYGANNPDRLRGIYLDGVVLDEFGDMDPTVWTQVIRPALSDRRGRAIFIGTPRGRNVFHRMWKRAEGDPDWCSLSLPASATGILDAAELADARSMMTEEEYAQEYECSFEAAVRGAYYGREINAAEADGRLSAVPHDPRLPVHTAWDLGMADSTVIWFFQAVGREIRVIDVLKGEGVGLDWYARELQQRGWLWGEHHLPHDVEVKELGTGRSRREVLYGLGIRATVCPSLPLADGIEAVRSLLPRCWFDKEKCADGIEALRMYRRTWDDKRREFSPAPWHDWTSHYADALRYFALGHRERPAMKKIKYPNYGIV